jgi:hypothetical protein
MENKLRKDTAGGREKQSAPTAGCYQQLFMQFMVFP